MARMLGKVCPSWCPVCKTPAGVDCPDRGKSKRQIRTRERAEVRKMLDEERTVGEARQVSATDC